MRKKITRDEIRERVQNAIIPDDPRQGLDEFQAAKILNVSVHWLRRARWAGNGPDFSRIGGRRLYDIASLEDYRNINKCNSTSGRK